MEVKYSFYLYKNQQENTANSFICLETKYRYPVALVLGCVYYKLKWKSSLMMSCQLNWLKLLEELLTNEGIARKIKGRGQPPVAEYWGSSPGKNYDCR